jgi:hypothetical protein
MAVSTQLVFIELTDAQHIWMHNSFARTYRIPIFFVYLFLGSAITDLSYGRFIAICYKFKLSTCIQEPLVIGWRDCVYRNLNGKTFSSR